MAPEQDQGLPEKKQSGNAAPSGAGESASPTPSGGPQALPYRAGITPGTVEITGIVPEGIHIDPDITEGHPGYEESGDSEIIPPERLARRETTP